MERRRGARIPAQVWIEIRGVDTAPVLRRGDVSVSGLYVEVDQAVGEAGSVQSVCVAPESRESSVEVLARVVRVVRIEDIWHGAGVAGIAFEFLPETNEKRQALAHLVRVVMASQSYVVDSLQSQLDARVDLAAHPAADATVVGFGVRGMVLDTQWPAEVGETICCQLHTPKTDREASLTGQVVRSTRVPQDNGREHYRVEVAFPSEAPERAPSIGEAVDTLLDEVLFDGADGPDRPRDHLKGALARISLPSLLSFFELERMTGELALEQGEEIARVFLREGRVVDVEGSAAAATPRGRLAELLSWESGQFEFAILPVDRPDRVESATSALLLDIARETDEAGA